MSQSPDWDYIQSQFTPSIKQFSDLARKLDYNDAIVAIIREAMKASLALGLFPSPHQISPPPSSNTNTIPTLLYRILNQHLQHLFPPLKKQYFLSNQKACLHRLHPPPQNQQQMKTTLQQKAHTHPYRNIYEPKTKSLIETCLDAILCFSLMTHGRLKQPMKLSMQRHWYYR